jgi:hypothetical protein
MKIFKDILFKFFDTSENFAIYGAGFYGSYIALNLKPHLKASRPNIAIPTQDSPIG